MARQQKTVSHCKRSKMPVTAPPSHRNAPITIIWQNANNKPDIHIRCHHASAVMAFQKSKLLAETSICDRTIGIRNASKTCWIWTKTTEAKMVGNILRTKPSAELLQSIIMAWLSTVDDVYACVCKQALILRLPELHTYIEQA